MGTLIECKLIRKGGTRAEVGGIEYHFTPYADGAHVCDIGNDDHADRFLSITEGYRLYRGNAQAETEAEVIEDAGEDRAALVAQYTERFGKAPHGRLSIDKLRAALSN